MKRHTALPAAGLAACALALGCVSGGCAIDKEQRASDAGATPSERSARTVPQVPEARQVGEAFVGIAERLAPAVVRITVRQRSPGGAASPPRG